MREYSHAFKDQGTGIYSKFIEIFNSGVVYYGLQERRFIKTMREQYGLNVVFTELSLFNRRAGIEVYVDFQGNTCGVAEELYAILRKNEVVHRPLNDDTIMKTVSEALQGFVNDVTDIFLDSFSYKKADLDEVSLYMSDFVRSFLARIHSISLQDIRTYIKTTIGTTGIWRIITGDEPSITIVAEDDRTYQKLLLKKRKMVKDCYTIMKSRDNFDLLTEPDVNILIRSKVHLSKDEVNRYAREIV